MCERERQGVCERETESVCERETERRREWLVSLLLLLATRVGQARCLCEDAAMSSQKTCFKPSFSKVNSPTNPSTYFSLFLVIKLS